MMSSNVHGLRVTDKSHTWKLIYHLAPNTVVILEIFSKKTNLTLQRFIRICQQRLVYYYSQEKTMDAKRVKELKNEG